MRIRKHLLWSVAVLATWLVGPAMADDFAPPPWYDPGHPYTTLQAWEFLSPANPAQPDGHGGGLPLIVGDGGGQPTATMTDMFWDPFDGGGVWIPFLPTGGYIDLYIPNWIDFEPYKLIRCQITFIGSPSNPPVITGIQAQDNVAPDVLGVPTGSGLVDIDPFNGISGVYYDWTLYPNPNWEIINIFVPADTAIMQIVVDTISIPEPASMALLALGGLVMIRRGSAQVFTRRR